MYTHIYTHVYIYCIPTVICIIHANVCNTYKYIHKCIIHTCAYILYIQMYTQCIYTYTYK